MPRRLLRPLLTILTLAVPVVVVRFDTMATFGATPVATPTAQVRVRPDSSPLPSGCQPAQVARIVTDVVDAFSRGDQAALARFFSPRASHAPDNTLFHWYSVSGAGAAFFVSYNRDDLLAYAARRYAQHEHLQLLRLDVSSSWHPGVDIGYELLRRADDLAERRVLGKGAINCEARPPTIFAWSMGDAPPESPGATPPRAP